MSICLISLGNAQINGISENQLFESEVYQKMGFAEIKLNYYKLSGTELILGSSKLDWGLFIEPSDFRKSFIYFSEDVLFNTSEVKKGYYFLRIQPDINSCLIRLESTTPTFIVDPTAKVITFSVAIQPTPFFVNSLNWTIDNLNTRGGNLIFSWQNHSFSLPFEFDTYEIGLKKFRETLVKETATAKDYFNAAAFCHEENINHDEALLWIQKAIAMDPSFLNYLLISNMYRKQGKRSDAKKYLLLAADKANEEQVLFISNDLIAEKNYDLAERIIYKKMKNSGYDVDLILQIGKIHVAEGNKDKAQANLKKLIKQLTIQQDIERVNRQINLLK